MSENIYTKLTATQQKLNAPKSKWNDFGKYHYRSCEDILEALKPILPEGCSIFINDEITQVGDRYYVKAVATFTDGTNTISVSAYAREEETKKGMDASQLTGCCSSYARKYALNGLLLIDDSKDPDTDEYQKTSKSKTVPAESASVKPNQYNDISKETSSVQILTDADRLDILDYLSSAGINYDCQSEAENIRNKKLSLIAQLIELKADLSSMLKSYKKDSMNQMSIPALENAVEIKKGGRK